MSAARKTVEFYNRYFDLTDYCGFDSEKEPYSYDYMTLSPNTVTIPKILNIEIGGYLYSSNIQGVISSFEYADGQTAVSYYPLIKLLDVNVFHDRTKLQPSIFNFFKAMIEDNLVNNKDSSQNIPGLNVSIDKYSVDYSSAALNIVDNVNNIYELLVKALKKYNLCVVAELAPYDKKINMTIAIFDTYHRIKAKTPYVVYYDIFIKPENDGINKFIAVWKDDETKVLTFLKNENQEYSKFTTEYVDGENYEDFYAAALDKSYELFAYDDTSNYISITVLKDNNLYKDLKIGEIGLIEHEDKVYKAVLTKISTEGKLIEYVFGSVRLNLTDKLLLGGI